MNIKNYAELKESGDILVKEIEGQVRVVVKNYNPSNGELLDTAIFPVDKPSLERQEQDSLTVAAQIRVFLDDVEAVELEMK